MSFINIQVPTYPYFSHSGNAIYRPGDKHRARKGIEFFDLLVVEHGTLYMSINEKDFTLSQNYALFIPPYFSHRGTKICTEKTLFHWLHFKTSEFFELSDILTAPARKSATIMKDDQYTLTFPQVQKLPDETAGNVFSLMEQLETYSINFFTNSTVNSKTENTLFHQQELFLQLLDILSIKPESKMDNDIAYAAMQYLNSHYSEPITLELLSKKLNCHPTHLIRCVKRQYGQPPNQMLIRVRLLRACELLKDPRMSITSIAYSVGFSSTSYFCKQFKKIYKYSPREYRQKMPQYP